MSRFQVGLETDVELHIGLAVAHRRASLEIMSPWENISALRQKALGESDATLLDCQKGAADGEVAWGTSFHCMDLPHPA
jgi:hypothetical protein